jgi:hypothetical protein
MTSSEEKDIRNGFRGKTYDFNGPSINPADGLPIKTSLQETGANKPHPKVVASYAKVVAHRSSGK